MNHEQVEAFKSWLRDREVLLILDNFEEVAPAAPLLANCCWLSTG